LIGPLPVGGVTVFAEHDVTLPVHDLAAPVLPHHPCDPLGVGVPVRQAGHQGEALVGPDRRRGDRPLHRLKGWGFGVVCRADLGGRGGHAHGMRYPDSGGLSPEARAKREAVRLQAAEMFAAGRDTGEIAHRLRVTRKSVNRWKRGWKTGGRAALASTGPGGSRCRLDEGQLARLQAELDTGPAGHGWAEDQRWTLARVAALIFALFRVRYTPRGVSYLLHRIGWTPQVPAHRAAERDEEKILRWREASWPEIKGRRGSWARGSSLPTSPASRSGRPRPAPGPGAVSPRSCG